MNQINQLNQYLEKLFSLSRTDILVRDKKAKIQKPSKAFATYLENKLKYEFSLLNPKTKNSILADTRLPAEASAQAGSWFNWYTFLDLFRLPAFQLATVSFLVLLFLTGLFFYPKLKNRELLASLEKSVVNLDQELAYLDQESQEIEQFNEEEIEEDINLIQNIQ